MIKTIWDNVKNGVRLLINNDSAETGILIQGIDVGDVYDPGNMVAVELEVLTNGTAPGSTKNLTIYSAFSSSGSKQPAELATAADSLVCVLANAANVRRVYMMPVYYISARYLYVWFDHDALSNGATLDLTLRINRLTARP